MINTSSKKTSKEKTKMSKGNKIMFYLSALIAIIGAVSYQFFVKKVPAQINPVVSVIGLYMAVLVMGFLVLPFFPAEGGLVKQFKQLNWVQLVMAASVLLMELGFLLMYRYGWTLSTGNIVTGVVINIALVALGVFLLREKLSLINIIGVVISIAGVALISFRS
jgi:drug/metabolite transporter (DMT)-like permease